MTRIRNAALHVMAGTGTLAASAEVLGNGAPTWWHTVTMTAAVVGVVAHAVADGTRPLDDQ